MGLNRSLNEGRIQPDDDIVEYEVVWRINVSAWTPEGAAKEARNIQLDPASTATVFEVSESASEPVTIDLDET